MKSSQCLVLCLFTVVAVTVGCTSARTTNTARTGIEQLLISNAVDQSLDAVDFRPFYGKKVYLEEKYMDSVDKSYILGSIRHRVLRSGARLVPKVDEADIVLEPRSGGVGTDTAESFVGVPEITLPGMLTLPEVRLITKSNQTGIAKLGLVAYDAKTMQVLGDGGVTLANSDDNNWYFLGIGPYQNGSLRDEFNRSVLRKKPQKFSEIPRQVAFNTPSESGGHSEPGRFQLTGGEEEE